MYPALAFALFFSVRYLSAFYGLDMVEYGYHLVNQTLANCEGIHFAAKNPFWWLSDMIGGAWLRLGGGLWGAQFGGILVGSASTALSAALVFLVHTPTIFAVLAIVGASLFAQDICLIQYTSVPTFFYLSLSFCLLKISLRPDQFRWQWMSGVLFSLMVFSRLPMIVFSGVLGLCAALAWRKKKLEAVAGYGRVALVFLCCLAAAGATFWKLGIFRECFFPSTMNQYYSFSSLLSLVAFQLFRKIPYLSIVFGLPFLLHFFGGRKEYLLLLVLICLSILGSPFVHQSGFIAKLCPFLFNREHAQMSVALLLLGLALLQAYLLRAGQPGSALSFPLQEELLLLLCMAFPLLIMIGSANGLIKTHLGIAPLAGLIVCQAIQLKQGKIGDRYLFSAGSALLIAVGVLGWNHLFRGFLNDSSDRTDLSAVLKSSKLAGIHTSAARADSIESLIEQIGRRSRSDERIFAYHSLPLLYFAADRLPLANHPPWLIQLDRIRLKKVLEDFSPADPPALVVRCKMDPHSRSWGLKKLPLWAEDRQRHEMLEKIALIDREIEKKWKLDLVWSNADFDLFSARK